MSSKKFYIIRLGCASLQADEIKIASCLQKNALSLSSGIEDADIIIVLTCGFSYKPYNESIDKVKEINNNKKKSAKIWVGGCIPAINKNFTQELSFEIDLIFAPRNFEKVLNEYINKHPFLFQTSDTIAEYNQSEIYPIRIINGCTENCAYCVIKRAGGKALSQPISKLEQEIRNIGDRIKCISLVGEDIGAYGKDIDASLEELIKLIIQIHPEIKISFSTIHPKYFVQDFEMYVRIFNTHKNLDLVLPVPIQSGSNMVLKLMKRDYNIDDVVNCFQIFTDKFPDVKISTDVMVGYPGETWDSFLLTKRMVEKLPLAALSCFKFDDMTKIGNTISEEEKIKRLKIISLAFFRNYCKKNNIQDSNALKHYLDKDKILLNINF